MYDRLCIPLLSKSFFLFGGRGTGKSTLLKTLFQREEPLWLDLLEDELARKLSVRPGLLLDLVRAKKYFWVVIDEVQKVPRLLDYVQKLIVENKIKFALTGSSARKLKRGGANLLAGRALVNHLFPLTAFELKDDFDLERVLRLGSLPEVIQSTNTEEAQDTLRAYSDIYLKEEIMVEQLVRQIIPFRRFLEVAAQTNGQPINASKLGRDCEVDDTAIQRYYEILEDTLVGCFLLPFHRSLRKRQSSRSKFYFFDLGIKRALDFSLTSALQEGTYAYGQAFEHFIILECIRLNLYLKCDFRFSYLRTKDDFEIDLIIERPGLPLALVEIKSSKQVDDIEINRFQRFSAELNKSEAFIFCRESRVRKYGKVTVYPWMEGLKEIFSGNRH